MATTSNVLTLTSAHNFTSGEKVTLFHFSYNKVDLDGRFFYVKVYDAYTVSLYYDSSLTNSLDLTNVTFSADARIVPVQYTPAPLYNTCTTFSLDGRGILNRNSQSLILSTNQLNYSLTPGNLVSYIPGITDVTLTINSGVYVWANATSVAALTISGFIAGDTLTIINNGYIMGQGGKGGGGSVYTSGVSPPATPGNPGGPAISLGMNLTLDNQGYIGGGGGGGGGPKSGGGAGGGDGSEGIYTLVSPGLGAAAPGGTGGSGSFYNNPSGYYQQAQAAGGGGRIMPGVGGTNGGGGGAGGSGGISRSNYDSGNPGPGGSAGAVGSVPTGSGFGGRASGGGGGGGWGAAGGANNASVPVPGGAGGAAIQLNGYTVTYTTVGTIYGQVA